MIRYVIVDDEPIAHRIIEKYASEVPHLSKAGNCYNPVEAISMLRQNTIDLIFLDIKMPRMSGFTFLKSLRDVPEIIITTAYEQYALEGYEFAVTDYLLKPFSFERFIKAIGRVRAREDTIQDKIPTDEPGENRMFIKTDREHKQVSLDDIRYIQAYGNYCKVYLSDEMLITPKKISDFESELPSDWFARIHKSYMISKLHIESISGNKVQILNEYLPVGETYKHVIDRLLNG
ncbi:LytR/AlgR family response regulator transcription factor [Roseivirga sp. BDSF3-8]|uniref:LytR/AlgR family response regulator transcription factor n=1 Tax=Roseivirga sp. BDSF3-8 TaxID=3241598 RepID=UPI00353229E9